MIKAISVLPLILALSACATLTVMDPRACPTERKYSRAEQQALRAAVPKTPHVVKLALVDYGKLRDQSRACRGETVPK